MSARGVSLIVTVPLTPPELIVAVVLDRETAAPVAISGLAEQPGSDLDEAARQVAAIVNVALRRGATLDEIAAELPKASSRAGVVVQLVPALIQTAIEEAARALAAHPPAGGAKT